MRKLFLVSTLAAIVAMPVVAEELKTLQTDEQKVGYSFGMMLGKRMVSDTPELDINAFVQGIKDGFSGQSPLLTETQINEVIQGFQVKQREVQMAKFEKIAEDNKIQGSAFLAENKGKDGVKTTASGLQYRIIKAGTGVKPSASDTVKVHYEGSLINGTVFDSSIKRGEPVSFPVGGVIKGWTEALQIMPEGSKWQLFIPSDLAYGPGGNRNIGPNEVLLFDVELLEVQKGQ
ncbi:MAG: FKBP-type peptidyl-prolyl cis-trans isomerase [Hahellaceae bacterium]|nr:FKBP-type peptidyl-prolyl cis-trans isomerase [Hahellaceae bacterium]MCP5210134.1 FKBP-type peptidyl-prolyl cis-trans isomerase [Hahellaceae bacterium]